MKYAPIFFKNWTWDNPNTPYKHTNLYEIYGGLAKFIDIQLLPQQVIQLHPKTLLCQ
jgi:hypothetical protein